MVHWKYLLGIVSKSADLQDQIQYIKIQDIKIIKKYIKCNFFEKIALKEEIR